MKVMGEIVWNTWHGCKKYSEGCENCYMFYLDEQRGKNGSEIYKVKNNFNMPLKKDRYGNYKIQSNTLVRVCLTSDFFLEEADEWRDEVWLMIKSRPDLRFWILTKRAFRIADCLPNDWGEGWNNVILNVTVENQKRADERIPILLDIPAKHKGIMAAPLLSEIYIEPYLRNNQIEHIIADGENYRGARPCNYNWIKSLYEQCKSYNVKFEFLGTGDIFIKDGKEYHICKAYQKVQAIRSGLNYPPIFKDVPIQKRCVYCSRRFTCNGCDWCGKCIK